MAWEAELAGSIDGAPRNYASIAQYRLIRTRLKQREKVQCIVDPQNSLKQENNKQRVKYTVILMIHAAPSQELRRICQARVTTAAGHLLEKQPCIPLLKW